MTDKDDLFVGLMAADIDPVTAYVVAESEAERDDRKPVETAEGPNASVAAVFAIVGFVIWLVVMLS